MKVLYLTNIPSPYRVEFFNRLGKQCDLTVWYEYHKEPKENRDSSWEDDRAVFYKAEYDFTFSKFVDYDIIVICGISSTTEMSAIVYLKMHKIPYYLEIDGGFPKKDFWVKKWIKTYFISGAKRYLSTGEEADKYLVRYGADYEKIRHYHFSSVCKEQVRTTVVSQKEKAELRQKYDISGAKVLIYVGRMVECKGIDILLSAVNSINEPINLLMIGGRLPRKYNEEISKNPLVHIEILPFTMPEKLIDYYKLSDVFVFPTRSDIWGLVINEAFAQGLPVISSSRAIAGLEMISDGYNGYIFENNNVRDLRSKIEQFLELEDLEVQQFAEGCLKVASEYTIDNMVFEHMIIFGEKEVE